MYMKAFKITDTDTNIPNLITISSYVKSTVKYQITKVIEKAFPQPIQVIKIIKLSDCWWAIITTGPKQTRSKAIKVELISEI